MRNIVCQTLITQFQQQPFAFLTGDLGFMALEPLREVMGKWFINAGVAEQNMVSVGAGLVKTGITTWLYSIAPFLYARPFEQIRNDICLQNLPVKLIGNGGGYAYGSMGSSHHAIEDYGSLLTLQNMQAYIPAFAEDIAPIIAKMSTLSAPAYLRLGKCEKPANYTLPPYSAWRQLCAGSGPIILGIGPLMGSLLQTALTLAAADRPEIWLLTELPLALNTISVKFIASIQQSQRLILVEEHVAQGGMGQMMALWLMQNNISVKHFEHICAKGYPAELYGSQQFHRKENGLDSQSIINAWNKMKYLTPETVINGHAD